MVPDIAPGVNPQILSQSSTQVGVISDTHGLLRPEALAALTGSNLILHAGDIGSLEVLTELGKIAPVIAIRGNNDKGPWAETIPERETVQIEGVAVYLLHSVKDLDLDPKSAGIQVVISGHSHKPAITTDNGILFLNPGSAGPRRFKLPISVARLQIEGSEVQSALVELQV
ncbi:metallophosphoesterase family protein [Pseudanabaena sp. FACHB-2040]|uniref:metallophosphoesterase family protein n=1 Tax=Pseudanabaena sp. FACHB-2040 TaxID=2692859 RepID=UPI001683810E|nr:metallophosphoesterase family protein [Pseudanabaena sp. FACHB-2040]MBD2259756.1 metallophosphoesterase family protein [Pseudanabaena sp. FACHB-2040]